jgi:hypothetical protein
MVSGKVAMLFIASRVQIEVQIVANIVREDGE